MVRLDKVAGAAAVDAGAILPGFTMGIRADEAKCERPCQALRVGTLFRINEVYKSVADDLVDSVASNKGSRRSDD